MKTEEQNQRQDNGERNKHIMEFIDHGHSIAEVAKAFKLSVTTITKVKHSETKRRKLVKDLSNGKASTYDILFNALHRDSVLFNPLARAGMDIDKVVEMYKEDNYMDDLLKLKGIGEDTRSKVREYIIEYVNKQA